MKTKYQGVIMEELKLALNLGVLSYVASLLLIWYSYIDRKIDNITGIFQSYPAANIIYWVICRWVGTNNTYDTESEDRSQKRANVINWKKTSP